MNCFEHLSVSICTIYFANRTYHARSCLRQTRFWCWHQQARILRAFFYYMNGVPGVCVLYSPGGGYATQQCCRSRLALGYWHWTLSMHGGSAVCKLESHSEACEGDAVTFCGGCLSGCFSCWPLQTWFLLYNAAIQAHYCCIEKFSWSVR